MTGFWDNDNPRTTNLPNPLNELPQAILDEHLGTVSNFVGLMDTPEKVQQHLDAVMQYRTVRESLLPADMNYSNTVVNPDALIAPVCTLFGLPVDPVESARLAWKAAVTKRKRVLAELDEEVRTLHAAFTAIKNR